MTMTDCSSFRVRCFPQALDEDALIRVLTEPKNALQAQYRGLFEMEDVCFGVHWPVLCRFIC